MVFRETQILTSRGFLTGLFLLLANDFYFKRAFGGQITGKLSDFAGLFVFTLFWIAVFPKFRRVVCVVVAMAFVFWKSSYSQPALDAWNHLELGRISRTVDPTDLIALPMVLLAHWYSRRSPQPSWVPREAVILIALVSLFAFTATSYRTKFEYQNHYYFQGSKNELLDKIDELHLTYYDFPLRAEERKSEKLDLTIPADICGDTISAIMEVSEADQRTIVTLKELEHRCPEGSGDKERLLREFEKEFIERLETNTPQTKHYKSRTSAKKEANSEVRPYIPIVRLCLYGTGTACSLRSGSLSNFA